MNKSVERALQLAGRVPGMHCSGLYPAGLIEKIPDGEHLYVSEMEDGVAFHMISQHNKIVAANTMFVNAEDLRRTTAQKSLNDWSQKCKLKA